jgi:hypothetical protein
METLTIKTNNVPRDCTMGMHFMGSLRQKLLQEFDYISIEDFLSTEFFKYRGVWYAVTDFLWINYDSPFDKNKWNGYASDSYFSGVVIKYCYDGTVVVGTYFS